MVHAVIIFLGSAAPFSVGLYFYDDTRHRHLHSSIQAANTAVEHQCDCFAFATESENKVDVGACLLYEWLQK